MDSKKKFLLLPTLIIVLILILATTGIAAEDSGESPAAAKTEQIKSLFKDVSTTDNNAIFINYLANLKIISGYPDGSYHPQEGLTRAQAAVVLVKAAGMDAPAVMETGFGDVGAEHWAANSIAAASKAGFLKGYPDGNYHPEEQFTRAQGIALVMRLSTQQDRHQLPVLKDMDQNHWAAGDMAVALAAGMIGLSSDNSQVYPDNAMTRGSLARALGTLLTKDPGLYNKSLAGTIKEAKGEIKLTRQGKTTSLQTDAPVYAEDTITSGANSTASIVYPDGSSVLIKENSEIHIKESAGRAYIKQDGSSGIAVENVDIDLKKGTLFGALATKHEDKEKLQAQKSYPLLASLEGLSYLAESQSSKAAPWYQQAEAKKVKMKVDMPWGVASIRGTFILVSVNQDGSCNVSCLTGDAEVSGRSGNTVSLGGGQSSGVNQEGTAGPAAPMTDTEKEQFSSVQQWIVNTALQIDQNREAAPPPVVEILVEIPDQPAAPPALQAEQVKNTIEVVLDALKSSGIQLTEQTKSELENKLKEVQEDISKKALETLETIDTQETNTNQSNSGVSGGTEEGSSVSHINYATAGTYGPENSASPQSISKNVIVSSRDITLQNMIITRDLTLAAGIGDGSVTLKNVTVQGNTVIYGGGPNSVVLEDCELYTVTVDNQTNTVRIVAQGNTTVGELTLNSGAKLEENNISESGSGFSSVTTGVSIPPGATIILSGSFAAVNIQAPELIIQVAEGSIEQINVSPAAGGTALTLAEGVSVSTLQVNAAASIGGAGTIVNASINAGSVVMEQVPSNLNVSAGVNASVGGQTVSSGNTQIVSNVIISGSSSINIPASEEITENYSAVVKDQNGNIMSEESVSWSLLSPVAGVSIDTGGILTVSSNTTANSCTIVATSSSNTSRTDQLQVNLNAFQPEVTSIEISGETTINIPASGETTESYSATVKDQNGNIMSEESVSWSLLSPVAGVSIDAGGVLTVSSNTTANSCTIAATSSSNTSRTDQLQVNLNAFQPEVTSIEISGANTINIPASGQISENYSVVVKDQNGNTMNGENIGWSLLSPVAGVSIDSSGILTVSSSTTAESCTIVATSTSNTSTTSQLQVSLITTSLDTAEIQGTAKLSDLTGDDADHSGIIITVKGLAADGNPIEYTTSTAVYGSFTFTNLPACNFILEASKTGYSSTNKLVDTFNNQTTVLDEIIMLYPEIINGSVEGYAKFIDQQNHQGIGIQIQTLEGQILPNLIGATDTLGYFKFDNVPVDNQTNSANYIFTAFALDNSLNYGTDSVQVSVYANQLTTINNSLWLRPAAAELIIFADDSTPWDSNALAEALQEFGNAYTIHSSSEMATLPLPLNKTVWIINDQPQAFYNNYKASKDRFDDFVNQGGTILFEACDKGWNGGSLSLAGATLPGNVVNQQRYDSYNTNINPTHPMMSGVDINLTGNSASHNYFTGLPEIATILCVDGSEGPTLVEYKYGQGRVVATGQPLEFYRNNINNIYQIYLNMIAYTFNKPTAAGLTEPFFILSNGDESIEPVKSQNTTTYIANVAAEVGSITITPVAAVGRISVNGVTVGSGTCSQPINLVAGSNMIRIVVFENGKLPRTYTIAVTRGLQLITD